MVTKVSCYLLSSMSSSVSSLISWCKGRHYWPILALFPGYFPHTESHSQTPKKNCLGTRLLQYLVPNFVVGTMMSNVFVLSVSSSVRKNACCRTEHQDDITVCYKVSAVCVSGSPLTRNNISLLTTPSESSVSNPEKTKQMTVKLCKIM